MSYVTPPLANPRGGSFLSFQPTPGARSSVMLDVVLNPANSFRSTNGPICRRGSEQSTINNRYQSYLAELGLNVLMGNGPLYGLRGQPDVPPNIEVKWAKRGDKLIVSTRHLEAHLRYVLSTGDQEIAYVGWAWGSELKRPWMQHAFYSESNELRPMAELAYSRN